MSTPVRALRTRPSRMCWVASGATMLLLATGLAPAASSAVVADRGAVSSAGAAPPVTVRHDAHHAVSRPLRSIAPSRNAGTSHPALHGPALAGGGTTSTTHLQRATPTVAALSSPVADFDAEGVTTPGGFSVGGTPADPNSDVGPTQVVEIVNSSIAVYSKAGATVLAPHATNTLWSTFGGPCQTNNDGDGVVRYDPLADRWVIMQFAIPTAYGNPGPNYECFAVSKTSDATGAYNLYAFSFTGIPDYGKLGVWPDGYYVTYNMFNAGGTAYTGAESCAVDRASMLAGTTATELCTAPNAAYFGLLPADLDGTTPPPTGAPNYEVSLGTSSSLYAWKFHVDWATPTNSTFTGPTVIGVASYSGACASSYHCIPQPSPGATLDSLGDRLMFPLQYRNFGTYGALTVSHAVTAGTTTGERWYELRVDQTTATPTVSLAQQGTYAPADGEYRWMGSAAMDKAGNMALGYSIGNASTNPSIAYTGRQFADPAGTMTSAEIVNKAGTAVEQGSYGRWGDYSSMSVDPSDDCTFWYTAMYFATTGQFTWATHISSFRFPTCATDTFTMALSPVSGTTSAGTATTTVNTTTTKGSAEPVNLSVTGLPTGVTAAFSPSTVTSGSSSTLTLTAGPTASAGTYNVTVAGQSASTRTTAPFTLTVQPDFSVSVSPASATPTAAGDLTATVQTQATVASPGALTLSLSGVPTGATASLNPTSVAPGSSSTLTVNPGTAASGSYPITITAQDAANSVTHTTTFTLNVTGQFSISVTPDSATASVPGTIDASVQTGVVLGDAVPVDLSVSGLPTGMTASFSPTSVTAGGSSTLTVDPGTAASGSYPLTITGAETGKPSNTHSTGYTITVGTDFSMATSPSSGAAGATTPAQTVVSTSPTLGSAASLNLSVTGLPAGASANFSPANAVAGASSTLSISAGTAADGSYPLTITATDASDSTVTHSVSYTLAVDRTAPTAHLTAPSGPFVVGSSAPVSWTSSDAGSGVTGVDVRFVRAPWSGGFGPWPATPQWRNLAATGSKPAALTQGYTTCFEVRAHDAAGNTGAWSAMRCVAVPLDDRALSTSAGWTRISGNAYWNGTATRTTAAGKTLSLAGAVADRIGVLATRCATCGSVRVLIGTTVIGTIDLSATRTGQHMFLLPQFALRSGTVVLKTLSAKTVIIDGLLVTRA